MIMYKPVFVHSRSLLGEVVTKLLDTPAYGRNADCRVVRVVLEVCVDRFHRWRIH